MASLAAWVASITLALAGCISEPTTEPSPTPPTPSNPAQGPCSHLWQAGAAHQVLLRAIILPASTASTEAVNVTFEKAGAVVDRNVTDRDGCIRFVAPGAGEHVAKGSRADPGSSRCTYDGKRTVVVDRELVEDDLVLGKTCR